MKARALLLLTISWVALICANAGASDLASQAVDKATGPRSGEAGADTQAPGKTQQTDGQYSAEDRRNAGGATRIVGKKPSLSHSRQVAHHQARSVTKQRTDESETRMAATATNFQQADFGKSTRVQNRVVGNHNSRVRPAGVAALNGQQFVNGRNRTASLAIAGGPATATRNTAGINGTEMKRKP